MRVKKIVQLPANMRCYTCEFEGRKLTRRRTDMYINSPKLWATHGNAVLWKCPRCGKSRVEKFKTKDEAVQFWNYCDTKGWVLLNDNLYHGRKP